MGLFDKLFKTSSSTINFSPDLHKTEYNNWLDFLDLGGTSEQWEKLKKENAWKFKKDKVDVFLQYQNEVKAISDKYYLLMQQIEKEWSALYKSKDYEGDSAKEFEQECLEDISCYKQMNAINRKYGEKSPQNVPAYTRLIMLYEKQKKYEQAIMVCREACSYGINEQDRLERLLKK